ncbi:MAG TPA: FAD-dependent oxidoreductase [Drouetiella sp.]|jgi:protoporphyrinogen oxidase
MSSENFSRRQFLQAISRYLTTAGAISLACELADSWNLASAKEELLNSKSSYKIEPWTGDNFAIGHKLRNHELPEIPRNVEREVDFVIVGGGMAGLASAYYLQNHNFLLLEQYETLGGQSRGSSYRGVDYSYGAAYFNTVDGLMGELLADLKLTPLKLQPTKNSWRWENSWAAGLEGKNNLYSELKTLLANCKPIWNELNNGIPVPLELPSLQKLDATPFQDYMKSHSPAFTALIDAYLKASLCGGVGQLSALSAISTLEDLVVPTYVFPGGNQAIAKAMANKVKGERCGKGFVWSVDIGGNGKSTVTYLSPDQTAHKVACKHVIITAPPLVAARILHNVPDTTIADLLSFKYGSYLVANLLMRKKKFSGAYDNFVSPPFSFSDIVVAETPYIEQHKYDAASMGSVLTMYQPYVPSSEGRSVLMQGDRAALASSLVGQLGQLIGPIEKDIESVVLSRWGHAMAVTRPGFYSKISKLNRTADSGYTLAHCSTQGIPCAESAIAAARLAANRSLGKTGRS